MNETLLVAASILAGFVLVLFFVKKWLTELGRQKPNEEMLTLLKITHQRMDEQGKAINERLDNAARFISAVQKNIGEMTELGRGMKDLQDLLRSPKLRGNIGEQILKELLGQMLPKQSFHLQYAFKSGAIVDAAITTQHGIIPIDAKFPLENFRKLVSAEGEEKKIVMRDFERDVKKHIEDVSKKYILAEEGTIDYALLYLPSEAVYYEVVNNPTLFEYASQRRILPVSPMTFYAYLRTILLSMEGQKIEKEAKKILATIRAMQKDYVKVEENLGVLNKHMTNAYNQMAQVLGNFGVLGQKLTGMSQLEEEATVKQLEIKQ